jgi:glycosyltransferase involved in cell wall biosynthesis
MAAEHIIPGLEDPTCGIAVAAKQLIARGVGEDGEVWVHSMWSPMVIRGSIKALLAGKKLVRMPHGCTDPEKLRFHWHKKRWVAPIERWLFRRADRIIATCEDEIAWIKSFEPRVKKVELIELSPPKWENRSDLFSQNDITPSTCSESLKLLYVGRLHKLKGVNFLLDAIAQLPNPLYAELRLIGKDDGEGKSLKKQAARLNLNVTFEGIVSEETKNAAYDWCDALVLPTLSENFGLVIAEALERGRRVITTDGAPAWGDGNTYGGRLSYIRGYRDGTPAERIQLLKSAIENLCHS